MLREPLEDLKEQPVDKPLGSQNQQGVSPSTCARKDDSPICSLSVGVFAQDSCSQEGGLPAELRSRSPPLVRGGWAS